MTNTIKHRRTMKVLVATLLLTLVSVSFSTARTVVSTNSDDASREKQAAVSIVIGTDSINREEITFLNLLNNHRTSNGLSAVVLSRKLSNAASGHSEDMALKDYFSHVHQGCPTPNEPGNCLLIRIARTGYPTSTGLGEIIYGHGAFVGETGSEAFNAFRSSPGHNGVMLGASFRAVGIGQAYSSSTHKWYWTADFGGIDDADNYSGASDSTPPTVEITDPPSGAKVWGQVIITAASSDNRGVELVEFYLGGQYGFKDNDNSSPYTYSWDSTRYSGTATWQAKSYDDYGNTKWSNPVTYTVDSTAPTQSPTPPPTPTPSSTLSPSPTPSPQPSYTPTPTTTPSPTEPPTPTSPPPMPDLQPLRIELDPPAPVEGDQIRMTCVVTNIGSIDGGSFTVLLQLDNGPGLFARIQRLAVGENAWVPRYVNVTAGSHTARCTVDFYLEVAETDEENNVLRLPIQVQPSTTPSPTPSPTPSTTTPVPSETPHPSPTETPNATLPPNESPVPTPPPVPTATPIPPASPSPTPSSSPSNYTQTTTPATTPAQSTPGVTPTSDQQDNSEPQRTPVQFIVFSVAAMLIVLTQRNRRIRNT